MKGGILLHFGISLEHLELTWSEISFFLLKMSSPSTTTTDKMIFIIGYCHVLYKIIRPPVDGWFTMASQCAIPVLSCFLFPSDSLIFVRGM